MEPSSSNVSFRIVGWLSKVTTPARRLPSGCAMAARVPFGKGTYSAVSDSSSSSSCWWVSVVVWAISRSISGGTLLDTKDGP